MIIIKNYIKGMSTKQKIEYIYEYYKIQIIAVILVVFFIGYFIHLQVTRVDEIFNITFMGYFDDTKKTDLQDEITKLLGKAPGGKSQATVNFLPMVNINGDNSAIEQKLYVETATNQLDLLVMDKAYFDRYSKLNMFNRLDIIPQLDAMREKSKSLNRDVPYGKYGWNIKNNPIIKAIRLNNDDEIIGIVTSSKRTAQSEKVLEWILENR